jgi:hypothetical protein
MKREVTGCYVTSQFIVRNGLTQGSEWLWAMRPGSDSLQELGFVFLPPSLGPTQSLVQWIPHALSLGTKQS